MMLSLQQSVITRMHAWLEERFPPNHLVSPCFLLDNIKKNRWMWRFSGPRAWGSHVATYVLLEESVLPSFPPLLEVSGNRCFFQAGRQGNVGHVAFVPQGHPWGLVCFRAGPLKVPARGLRMYICSSLSFIIVTEIRFTWPAVILNATRRWNSPRSLLAFLALLFPLPFPCHRCEDEELCVTLVKKGPSYESPSICEAGLTLSDCFPAGCIRKCAIYPEGSTEGALWSRIDFHQW